MLLLKSRREREKVIVREMIRMFCAANHAAATVRCDECQSLAVYAEKRLFSCMYGEIKPVCKECPVHCYSPQRREQMKQVMRFAGPRMLLHNPVFAIIHFIDNLSAPKPGLKSKRKNA